MNKIKNHPGFMPFGHSNVKSTKEETQSKKDKSDSAKEKASDAQKGE